MTRPLSGIYQIVNLQNNKVYVGQSKNIYARRKQHFTSLYNGQHENKLMQADWNLQHGKHFVRHEIELCDIKQLNEREKYWINYYAQKGEVYNQGWVPYRRKEETTTTTFINKRKFKGYHKSR